VRFDTDSLNRIPILAVAKALGIEVQGRNAMCFNGHDRRTPSLVFFTETNTFHCFGCHIGATSIDLVKQKLGVPFVDAAQWLCDNFPGVFSKARAPHHPHFKSPRPHGHRREPPTTTAHAARDRGTLDIPVMEWLLERSPLKASGREYLTGRGFSIQTIDRFRISQLEYPQRIVAKLRHEFGDERLFDAGLLRHATDSRQNQHATTFLWWDNTLLFPIF
jgi:DNA primase